MAYFVETPNPKTSAVVRYSVLTYPVLGPWNGFLIPRSLVRVQPGSLQPSRLFYTLPSPDGHGLGHKRAFREASRTSFVARQPRACSS